MAVVSYAFDAETSVATLSMNDGKMNAFGFTAFEQVNAALDGACMPVAQMPCAQMPLSPQMNHRNECNRVPRSIHSGGEGPAR